MNISNFPEESITMEKCHKLFVGGLPVRVEQESIEEFFRQYGTVLHCKLKKNQQTGRSLGFAYLTVREKEASERLLNEQVIFQGRLIDIKPLWKKKDLGTKLEQEKKRKVFIIGLPQDATNEELQSYFEVFGSVSNAFIIKDQEVKKNKSYGYIIFKDESSVEKVLKADKLFFRSTIPIQAHSCTDPSEIALLKQTNSQKYSNTSNYSPNYTDSNKNSSPIDEYSWKDKLFAQSEKNKYSFHDSFSSPVNEDSTLSYSHPNVQAQKISSFGFPKRQPIARGSCDYTSELESGAKQFASPATTKRRSEFILFGMPPSKPQSNAVKIMSDRDSDDSSDDEQQYQCFEVNSKQGLLEASRKIDENEDNYSFKKSSSPTHSARLPNPSTT